ncbi:hypothetical protein, partial [Comamonas sp. JC664]|uniref:hypothetical protein n=1 Tax=Comamonas sp. JC664 TaxID=2801917 RepID=UPI001E62D923
LPCQGETVSVGFTEELPSFPLVPPCHLHTYRDTTSANDEFGEGLLQVACATSLFEDDANGSELRRLERIGIEHDWTHWG